MKYFFLSVLVLILFSVEKQSYAQEFWEVVDMPEGVGIYDIAFSQDNDIYVSVSASGEKQILKKSKSFEDWDTIWTNSYPIPNLIIDEYGHIYGAGSSKLIFSFDGGITWNEFPLDSISFSILSFHKLKNGNFLYGTWGGIVMSDSTGENAGFVLTTPNFEVIKDFTYSRDSACIYAGSTCYQANSGGIYKSSDDGISWENTALFGSYISSLCTNAEGDIFAGSHGHYSMGIGGVYRLLSGEEEWEHINENEIVSSIDIATNGDIFIGCTQMGWPGGVRISQDNGENWISLNNGLYSKNIGIVSISNDNYIYLAESGSPYPLYKSKDTIYVQQQSYVNDNKNIKIFPTPFRNYVSIKFPSIIKEDIEFQIIDINGDIVYSEIISSHFFEQIETSQLKQGIYFFVFKSKSQTIISKQLKL